LTPGEWIDMSIFKDLMWYFKLEKKSYITGVIILALVSMLTLLPPYVVGIVVDGIKEGTLKQAELMNWIMLLIGTGIIIYILRFIWRIMIFGSAIRLGKLLRNRLYEHFTKFARTHVISMT
jgi:ATP-binding cassette subfamily B multidrug efflux pump